MGPCIICQDLQQKPWKSSQTPGLTRAARALAGLPVPIPALQPARWVTPGEFPNSPKAQFPYLDHGKNHHLSDRALGGLHEAAHGKG